MGEIRQKIVILCAILGIFYLPFIQQAFHIDDANFLLLTQGIFQDFWRPHDIHLNWLGTSERAFDILSNPPGIAYLLAIPQYLGLSEAGHHLMIWPFIGLFAWGAWQLADYFCPTAPLAPLFIIFSPAIVVSGHTIMPDAPLIACYVGGLALGIRGCQRRRFSQALLGGLLMGSASLFRYSGLSAPFLWGLYLWLFHRQRGFGLAKSILLFAASWLPWATLATHEFFAYGTVHFLHMLGFQSAESAPNKGLYQAIAQLSFLGGTAIFPLITLLLPLPGGRKSPIVLAILTLLVSAGLAMNGDLHIDELWLFIPFLYAGLFLLTQGLMPVAQLFSTRFHTLNRQARHSLFLSAWFLGILLFNQFLRFTSVRYLLLAIPPILLLTFMQLEKDGASLLRRHLALITSAGLALALSVGDYQIAGAYRQAVEKHLPEHLDERPLYFVGHWGMQYYLEAQGAKALSSDGNPPPASSLLLSPRLPWPQELPPKTQLKAAITHLELGVDWPIRTLSITPGSCFYANALATQTPIDPEILQMPTPPDDARRIFLPWSISTGPLDRLSLFEVGAPHGP